MSNSTLIPVFAGVISGTTVQLCDARTLHTFMQVKRDFTTWIKGRIRKFGFVAGDDYLTVENLSSPDLVSAKARAQKLTDYHLTIDMAKELAMVENNEQGRAARRYFIACERQAMEVAAKPEQMRLDYDRISPAQAQDLKQIVQAIVDAGIQKYAETWARLQRKFKVHSYLALHPDQYEEARAYLIAKLPSRSSGVVFDVPPVSSNIAPNHNLAFSLANQAAAYVQREVFNSVMAGTADSQSGRYLLSFNADSASQDAGIHAQPVEREAVVLPIDRMHEAIEASSGMSALALTQLASACMEKLSQLAQNAVAPSSNIIEAQA